MSVRGQPRARWHEALNVTKNPYGVSLPCYSCRTLVCVSVSPHAPSYSGTTPLPTGSRSCVKERARIPQRWGHSVRDTSVSWSRKHRWCVPCDTAPERGGQARKKAAEASGPIDGEAPPPRDTDWPSRQTCASFFSRRSFLLRHTGVDGQWNARLPVGITRGKVGLLRIAHKLVN